MTTQERILIWILRLAGALMLLAWPAVFLPVDWMAATHRWLGLGEFPESALVDYLTRSISILYGIHGGLLLILANDLRRYRKVVVYLATMGVVFGALMIGVDLHAGLPASWTLTEGPPLLAVSVVMLWLLRSVPEGDRA